MPSTRMTFVTGSKADIHVVPVEDKRKHDRSRTCWCVPDLAEQPDGVVMVLHQSWPYDVGADDDCDFTDDYMNGDDD